MRLAVAAQVIPAACLFLGVRRCGEVALVFNLPYRSNQCSSCVQLNTVRLIAAIKSPAEGGGTGTICFCWSQTDFTEAKVCLNCPI